jgi:hypothetical protein
MSENGTSNKNRLRVRRVVDVPRGRGSHRAPRGREDQYSGVSRSCARRRRLAIDAGLGPPIRERQENVRPIGIFAFDRCLGFVYASQSERTYWRALRRADAIRRRLGGTAYSIDPPFPDKPQRMRWRTYSALKRKDEALRSHFLAGEVEVI